MQHLKHQTYSIYVITLIVIGAVAWQTQASRKLAPASPAVLVSVDFERVFSSLEERVFEQSRAQEVINAITQSLEARRQHIESYEQEFELYESGSDKWEELMQEQQLEVLEYQAQVEYRNLKAAREESKGMRRVYQHIREAVATLAKENGWDYVVVNDAAVSLPEGDNVDMGIQISNRRMLYANPTLDVTDVLIEYMNASFDEMAVR
jgi:Skp family chaperone for outer membrane proteins